MRALLERRNLAAHYYDNFGIHIDSEDVERLSEKQLLIKLETRLSLKKEYEAAKMMQSLARRFIYRIRYYDLLAKREKAALRI